VKIEGSRELFDSAYGHAVDTGKGGVPLSTTRTASLVVFDDRNGHFGPTQEADARTSLLNFGRTRGSIVALGFSNCRAG